MYARLGSGSSSVGLLVNTESLSRFSRVTSHHIEQTDASLDRPLYLRNKLYDKTLKSQNYYSNILRFPVPWRSAVWLYNTSLLDQNDFLLLDVVSD